MLIEIKEKLKKITSVKTDDLHKKGKCLICNDDEEENLFNLCGVEVCKGCYYDLINSMSYKNIDDLLDCDKKQLMKFLNKLSENKK